MMATLMSYLYGSLMPALMAQQQRNNITTQDPSVPAYPIPSYYSYPSTYPQQTIPQQDVTVNERVSRAAPTENSVTEAAPKHFETLPLDIIKHAIHKESHNHHHQHQHKKTLVNSTTATVAKPAAIELPIVCPKCGAKMKLLLSLTSAEAAHPHDFCACEDNKPKYVCECAQPQICEICNKIKKQATYNNWKQPSHSIIILRKANPTTPRRNVFAAPVQPPATVQSSSYSWGTQPAAVDYNAAVVEPSITKRYAVLPSSENIVYGGYEQQQQQQHQQEIGSIINAVYDAAEHVQEPTCYCWRCRFMRRY